MVEPSTGVLTPEPHTPTVVAYRPPTPVETPQEDGAWTGTQEDLLESITAWRPLKKVSQEDLDQALGPEVIPLPVTPSETPDPSPVGGEEASLLHAEDPRRSGGVR